MARYSVFDLYKKLASVRPHNYVIEKPSSLMGQHQILSLNRVGLFSKVFPESANPIRLK